jgi:hypothetical protein
MGIRIGCISAGVAVVTVLAIMIFPQAASEKARYAYPPLKSSQILCPLQCSNPYRNTWL